MFAKSSKPWWDRPNDFYLFNERDNFVRGAVAYQPNNRSEAYFSQIIAGYVNSKHQFPKSLGKKK